MISTRIAFGGIVAALLSTSAVAAPVVEGTVTSVATFNPAIDLSSNPASYSAANGPSFEISGTGSFAAAAGGTGRLNGMLSFSKTMDTVLAQNIANFFVFSDGQGGTYNYSVSSVLTKSFTQEMSTASGTLYTVGQIIDANLMKLSPTPASLSIQFNNTGGSAFSSALSLSVPPAMSTAVPEASSWAMMIVGVGAAGAAMRRKAKPASKILNA